MRPRVAKALRVAIQLIIALAPGGLIVVGLYQLHRHRMRRAERRADKAP